VVDKIYNRSDGRSEVLQKLIGAGRNAEGGDQDFREIQTFIYLSILMPFLMLEN
jgi:hypothetical protein